MAHGREVRENGFPETGTDFVVVDEWVCEPRMRQLGVRRGCGMMSGLKFFPLRDLPGLRTE